MLRLSDLASSKLAACLCGHGSVPGLTGSVADTVITKIQR